MTQEQTLLLCDESGVVTGYAGRAACHSGDGLLHRAIHVVLLDGTGRVLLQRRRSGLWDDIWDASCATHPLHHESGDETDVAAAHRCIAAEWGTRATLQEHFAFVYHEREGEHAEREYCTVFTGLLDAPPTLDPAYAYEMAWEDAGTLAIRMRAHPHRFTPWSCVAIERLFPAED